MGIDQADTAPQNLSSFAAAALIVEACADVKGQDLTALDVSAHSDIADYFVIVSGRSDRQVQGICRRIMEALGRRGIHPSGIEGLERAHWVLLDYQDVVVHIFYEPVRQVYRLENLWHQARRMIITDAADGKVSLQAA